jgi:hypothetical protein
MKTFLSGLLLFICFYSQAQVNFTRDLSIPVTGPSATLLANPWSGGFNFPGFSEIDLNADGIHDLFAFDQDNNRVLTFLNSGVPGTNSWTYAPQYAEQFPKMNGWAVLYDYNCDGKADLFTVNSHNNGIRQYRNDSPSGSVLFTLVDTTITMNSPFPVQPNILASAYLMPHFNDIDGDGDMDIIGQQFQCVGSFAYYQNMSIEHFGVCDSLNDYDLITNAWGKFAIRSGSYQYVTVATNGFNINCQSNQPVFEPADIARRDDTYASIFTLDTDGDNDMDALIGDSGANNSLFVENGGTSASALMVPPQDSIFPAYDVTSLIHAFSMHAYIDMDNDGNKDLLITPREWEDNRCIRFYKNNGTTANPVFAYQTDVLLQDQMIDVGEGAGPVLFDYNNDGLKDLIISNYWATNGLNVSRGLTLYENNGTLTNPSFMYVTSDYAGLSSTNLAGPYYPAFGDIDNDGDFDLVIGGDVGKFYLFTNTAGAGNIPSFTYTTPSVVDQIDVGQASTPQLIDLDRDGLLDLISGHKNGFIKYYKNNGSPGNPFFASTASSDSLGHVNVRQIGFVDGYSVPYFFEQQGSMRLAVAAMSGDIYLYGNIDSNLNGTFTILDTLYSQHFGVRYGYNITISGGDLNNDTLTDLVLGMYGGGMQVMMQQSNVGIAGIDPYSLIKVYPNPANNYLTVHDESGNRKSVCVLADFTGRVIATTKINSSYAHINLAGCSEGAYLLQIINDDFRITKKIIVVH